MGYGAGHVIRYRLTVAYDGTDFHGWQKQEPPDKDAPPGPDGRQPRLSLRTAQGVLETAVREVVREPVNVQGASRTDSGVHARHQTAAFSTTDDRIGPPDDRLRLAINSRLPDDIDVRDISRTHESFQPISDCRRTGNEDATNKENYNPYYKGATQATTH